MNFKFGNINLSKDDYKNIIRYENVDYLIKPLSENYNGSKGGNSNVFILIDPEDESESIIKFCKYDLNKPNPFTIKRIARFNREIEALEAAKEEGFNNIIDIIFDGYHTIGNKKFHYYVMEKADYDLTEYLNSEEVSNQQRFLLCLDILQGIKELHSIDIYHRDIKPDNILFVNGVWKIGDLGLIDYRESDFEIKEEGERIGPIGWLSPEAMNKYLNEGENRINRYELDCLLDSASDVFQLGKVFWYIFQGNIPIGQIRRGDFKIADKVLYKVFTKMIRHSKRERYSLNQIESQLSSRIEFYGV